MLECFLDQARQVGARAHVGTRELDRLLRDCSAEARLRERHLGERSRFAIDGARARRPCILGFLIFRLIGLRGWHTNKDSCPRGHGGPATH